MKSKLPAGVFFRSDRGVWCYLERQGGRRKLHTLGTDLADALKEHQKLIEGGAREKVRVDRAFARWLKEYVHVHRGEKGRAKAEQRGNDYFLSFMGFTLVDRVKPGDLRAYRKWLEAKKSKRKKLLSAQTVAHLLADARAFFRWCEDDGLIDRAPIPRKLLPKIQEQPPDRLTESECTALTSLKEPYGFVCRFGLATGLRWSEMYRAQSKDISGGMLVVHHTKSRKVRRVPLSAAILDELKDKVGRLVAVPDAPPAFRASADASQALSASMRIN